jgi:hypothetical protein
MMRLAFAVFALAALTPAAPAVAQQAAPAVTLAQARASTAGAWQGELQYLDYQSGEWQGIPVAVKVTLEGDGNTLTRRAEFDDGPQVGMVYITSMAILDKDGRTEYSTGFRAGRTPELGSDTLTLASAFDAAHWTILATRDGMDDNRPARIRETTTRDGASMVTLKEIDFLDEPGEQWFSRNRTVLERIPAPGHAQD